MTSSGTNSLFSQKELVILCILGALAFVFGMIGYYRHMVAIKQAVTLSDLAYLTANLYFMQFSEKGPLPLSLDIARWLAPATLSYTLIKTALGLMQQRLDKLKLRRLKNHAVIIGIDEHSVKVALSFHEKGVPTLAVDQDEQNEFWGQLKKKGVLTLVSNPSDQLLLTTVNMKHAKYLFAATQSDSTNLEIVYDTHRNKQRSKSQNILDTVCQIHNRSLRYSLYNRPLFATNFPSHNTRLVGYNAIAARWLLNEFGPHKLLHNFADLTCIKIVILGDDDVHFDLIHRIASLGIYAHCNSIHIILIGGKATSQYQELVSQSPAINELVKFDAIEITGYQYALQSKLQDICPDIVYVCENETDQKLLAIQHLLDNSFSGEIVVCELESQCTFEWLQDEFRHNKNIKFAEVNSATCDYNNIFENKLDALAKVIHDDYVNQQIAKGDSPAQNSSLVEWHLLPEILKDANRNQADHVLIKCQYLTGSTSPSFEDVQLALTQRNKISLAQMEHRRWLAEKKLAGWRYTPGTKNSVKKLSPSLLEWNDLSEVEKQKDIDTIEQLPELVKLMNKNT